MGVYSYEQIKNIIFTNPQKDLVKKAQEMRKLYSRHTHSVGYKDNLQRDKYVEDDACFTSRKSGAISNRDLFKRLLHKEDQVFTTTGGSTFYGLPKAQEDTMRALTDDVINGMSLQHWVHTYALQAFRSDPMSIIFMEAQEMLSFDGVNFPTPKCYPTYKSSDEIFDYLPNGRMLEYVCFNVSTEQLHDYGIIEQVVNSTGNYAGDNIKGYYRFVDDVSDTIYKRDNDTLTIVLMRQKNPIYHNFGRVPAFIVSDLFQFDDPKAFGSPLQFVIELAECFAYDRSVRDLHKKLHGFPKAVEPLISCTTCKTANGDSTGLYRGQACPDCTLPGQSIGSGYKVRTTPADVARFPLEMLKDIPRFKASDIFMYITPDIEGLTMMNDGLISLEDLIIATYWGTKPNVRVQSNGKGDMDETATKTLTNLQPEYARLNMTADWAENCIKNISNFIGKFWFPDMWKTNQTSVRLSRNYILELPEDILEVYHDMLKNGTPDVELDNQFKRFLMATYKSNPDKLAVAIKFYELQPFPHKTDVIVNAATDISVEDKVANIYFGEWMRTLNDLQKQFMMKDALLALFQQFCKDKTDAVKTEQQELAQQAADMKTAQQN